MWSLVKYDKCDTKCLYVEQASDVGNGGLHSGRTVCCEVILFKNCLNC